MSIQVLSSQPDRVTGGDARISVTPPKGSPLSAVKVSVDGHDVTERLEPVGGHLEGTVIGFVEGRSTLAATAGGQTVERRIRDYPITGPVFSGPHMPLPVCTTQNFGLGRATDEDCSAPEKVFYKYVSTDGTVKDLPDPAARPPDLARSTIKGRNVPLVVREERGVINRSVYFLATIDPTPGGPDSDQSDAAWNGRLVYRFGGGCGTSYSQGTPMTTVDDPKMLTEGYAVATATFNTFQVQCNDVLSAETVMMVKERFIEEFGVPVHTIGEGASGGSIQQHLIIQNYPGLLDAAAAILPFPDAITIAPGVTDCGLLTRFYATPAGKALTPEQRAAINGHAVAGTCDFWVRTFLSGIDPRAGCDPAIPKADLYDPVKKRNGIRCTLQDGNINQFGRDPKTGFARRPLDNVGVQYGLKALNAKKITVDQFLAVNQGAGGYDIDGKHQTAREVADPVALQAAYDDGRVSTGAGDQRKVPIIDVNIYTDPAGALVLEHPLGGLTPGPLPASVPSSSASRAVSRSICWARSVSSAARRAGPRARGERGPVEPVGPGLAGRRAVGACGGRGARGSLGSRGPGACGARGARGPVATGGSGAARPRPSCPPRRRSGPRCQAPPTARARTRGRARGRTGTPPAIPRRPRRPMACAPDRPADAARRRRRAASGSGGRSGARGRRTSDRAPRADRPDRPTDDRPGT